MQPNRHPDTLRGWKRLKESEACAAAPWRWVRTSEMLSIVFIRCSWYFCWEFSRRLLSRRQWPVRGRDRGFPGGARGKEPACQCRRRKRCGFDPWVEKIPWRRTWQPTPVFLLGEFHGQRSLAGYSPRGRKVRHDWSSIACMHRK